MKSIMTSKNAVGCQILGTIRKITKSPKIVKFQICPDSETRSKGQNHESRNREIAKSRNREKVHVLSGHRTPRSGSGSRIAKSRNREIAKKSHVLAGLRTPRSGVRIPNREIAKSRNREIAKSRNREKVTCPGRAPDSQIRGPDPESRKHEIAKSLAQSEHQIDGPYPGSRNREIMKSRRVS